MSWEHYAEAARQRAEYEDNARRAALHRQQQERYEAQRQGLPSSGEIFDRGYSSLGIDPRGGSVTRKPDGWVHHSVGGIGSDGGGYHSSWDQNPKDGSIREGHSTDQSDKTKTNWED